MKAFVFAGGRSERMFPFNQLHADKSMLWLPSGKPIIREIVDRLTDENTDFKQEDVVILTAAGYISPLKHEFRDTGVRFNYTDLQLGTLPHLMYAVKSNPDDSYLIHYADMQTDIRYDRLVSHHRASGKGATIVTVKAHSPYGHVYTKGGMVDGFEEKATLPPIWCGVGIINHNMLNDVHPMSLGDINGDTDIGFNLLPKLAKKGELVSFNHDGLWSDLGSVQAYRKLF